MRRLASALIACFVLVLGMAASARAAGPAAAPETVEAGRFGSVRLYRGGDQPQGVAIVVSDHGGWAAADESNTQLLLARGFAVIGIDLDPYLAALEANPDGCMTLNGDFQDVSQSIQKGLPFRQYHPPLLLGRGAGAMAVYGAVAQALPNVFDSAVGLDFVPEMDAKKPLCLAAEPPQKGRPVRYKPFTEHETPFVFTPNPRRFPAAEVQAFLAQMPDARVVAAQNAAKAIDAALAIIHQYDADEQANGRGLPLITIPPRGEDIHQTAIIYSGDGGWRDIDRQIGAYLADRGFTIIGIDSLRYFWRERKPAEVAGDLDQIIRNQQADWRGRNITLIGYSFGAEILPFVVNLLSHDARQQVRLMSLVGFTGHAQWEIQVTGWLGLVDEQAPSALPEIAKIHDIPVQCIFGADEEDSACRAPELDRSERLPLPGGHHFEGDYKRVANAIIAAALKAPAH